jgi:hypothetical protein
VNRLLRFLRRLVSAPEQPPVRVVPPVWASDDDIMLLRKAGLL